MRGDSTETRAAWMRNGAGKEAGYIPERCFPQWATPYDRPLTDIYVRGCLFSQFLLRSPDSWMDMGDVPNAPISRVCARLLWRVALVAYRPSQTILIHNKKRLSTLPHETGALPKAQAKCVRNTPRPSQLRWHCMFLIRLC